MREKLRVFLIDERKSVGHNFIRWLTTMWLTLLDSNSGLFRSAPRMAEKCKKNRLSLHSFEKCQSQCLFKNERASQGSCFALDTKQPHPLPSPHKATFTLLPSSGSPAPPEPHPPYTQLPDPARRTHAGNTGQSPGARGRLHRRTPSRHPKCPGHPPKA